ncbi:MAG: hypothetical protein K0Q77_2419 [Anaerosporomusa subterranea]|jgi:hypothetical protein|nr:hypothetical protein [Anaerosporomusa subterranea]
MASEQRPIVDTILGDVVALVPQFSSIVASYRLLVGSAEELGRTKGVCEEITERAIIRADRAGALIDMLLEILCTKIAFSTNFLAVSSAPVDVFRFLSAAYACDPSRLTAEQIIQLEALRQLLCRERSDCCFVDKTTGPCTPPPVTAKEAPTQIPSDIAEELETEVIQELASIVSPQRPTPT